MKAGDEHGCDGEARDEDGARGRRGSGTRERRHVAAGPPPRCWDARVRCHQAASAHRLEPHEVEKEDKAGPDTLVCGG